MRHTPRDLLTVLLVASSAACFSPSPESPANEPPIAGVWRAVLTSPGGELPFTLEVRGSGGELEAAVLNGAEEAPLSAVEREGSQVVFRFDWYDSEITAELEAEGRKLAGRWRRTGPEGDTSMSFVAERGDEGRFSPLEPASVTAAALESVEGHWATVFQDEDGTEEARGEFRQEGTTVYGTFLTPTGDYRYLAGSYEGGRLRLSTFDGAHAFLFAAQAEEDGSLTGDFYSRDSYHATWTARPIEEGVQVLPDAWTVVGLTNDEGRFSFRFPDLDGQPLGLDAPRFAEKVVLVNIFGSWCPNCNDEAPLLAEWYRRYRDRGFEMVGLAYEFSGDPERDRGMVRRFAERHGIEYPLLLAGISDKKEAAATLPDLSAVIAYPTSVFIGRDGKVRKIHTGFSGPGTGRHYEELVAELEGVIEELLAESV